MRLPLGLAFPAVAITVSALVAGCSSNQDRSAEGSLAVRLTASRSVAQPQRAGAVPEGPVSQLFAANVTFSEAEARRADGTWVPVENGFPAVVDVLALAKGPRATTLTADLLPEGQYNALQVRIAQVEPTRAQGARVTNVPAGAGWGVVIPIDFRVVAGHETFVDLNLRLDLSFKRVNDQFEFEPEFEVTGVEHD